MSRSGNWIFNQPYLLLFLTALLWGGNAVAGRAAVGHVSPMLFVLARWIVASAVVLFIAIPHLRKDWAVIRGRIIYLFAMGALGFTAFNVCFYNALHYTTAINVSVEQSGIPMAIVLASFLIFRERIGWALAGGVILSVSGVLITATHGDIFTLLELSMNRGDALMMLAVTLYAGYSVSLRYRPQVHWLSFMAALSVAATISSLPFAIYEYIDGAFVAPTRFGFLTILYVGLFPSLLAQIFFFRGVELIGANRAGVFINLVPVLGSLLAILLLGEEPALYHVVGYGLILSGIMIAQRRA